MTEWQINYVRYLLPVFKSGSRISEAKLTSKSLRKGSTECTKDVWPPVEQMTSRMGPRVDTGSRNMAVMAEIESSTPTSYSSPIACIDLLFYQPFGRRQTTTDFYFRFSKLQVVFLRQNWRPNRTSTTIQCKCRVRLWRWRSVCSWRSWQIFSMSLIFHCSPQANDSQYINVFLCLSLALLPSIIPVNAIASNWLFLMMCPTNPICLLTIIFRRFLDVLALSVLISKIVSNNYKVNYNTLKNITTLIVVWLI